ncbi:MAG TPA: hypothetical protein VE978_18655 [Chitinophagales bacterium]|nr:hypothetical protein [Chitinophagales bacterium]
MKILIVIVLIATIFSSCQYDPYAYKYTTEEPNNSDLIGTFIFEQQTVDFGIKEFKDSITGENVIPKIEIYKDGNYEVEYLPYFKGFDPHFERLITMNGTWEKSIVGGMQDRSGTLRNHWGIRLNGLPIELQNAGLMNKAPPYKIIIGFGDPDAGDVMILKKE